MNVGHAKREWFQVQPFSVSGSLKIEVTSKEERGGEKRFPWKFLKPKECTLACALFCVLHS